MKILEALVYLALIGVMIAFIVFLVEIVIDIHSDRKKGGAQ